MHSSESTADRRQPRVLVLGGTGFLGRSVCRQLIEHDTLVGGVTVATRETKNAAHLAGLARLEVAQVDVFDPAQLAPLIQRHDVVVNLVAILQGDERRFHRVHVELVEILSDLCNANGRPRIIHVSALGVGDHAPSMYLRSKTEGENRLKDAGVDATILRPSVIFGANDRFLNLFAQLLKFTPALPLACAHALFQPVWVEDVASAIARCVQLENVGRLYECVGPTVYELIELVRLTGRISNHPRPVLPLPSYLGRVQASLLECLPGEAMMSRDNLDSMKRPNVATGLPGLRDLGILASALEAIAPRYLSRAT